MRFHVLSILFISIVFLAGCEKSKPMTMQSEASLEQVQTASTSDSAIAPNTAVMYVHGMGCPQCAYNVDLQLLKIPGVKNIKVDMGTGQVLAEYNPQQPPTREQFAKAIEETGFTLVRFDMR